MERFLVNKMTLLLSLLSAIYGIYYLIPRTQELTHWQPPEIYILSWTMIILSVVIMESIRRNWKRLLGYSLVLLSVCWTVVTWRYFITPFPNSNTILSIGYVFTCWITLLRGDYSNGKV